MQRKKEGQSRKEALKRHLQTCPRCGQVWLVFGLEENEEYTCQTCRYRFLISSTEDTIATRARVAKR
jgi:hypothetical protein